MLIFRVILRKRLLVNSRVLRYLLRNINLTLNKLSSNSTMTLRRRTKGKNNGINMRILFRIRRKGRRITSLFIRLNNIVTITMTMLNNRLTIFTKKRSRVVFIIFIQTNIIRSLHVIFKNDINLIKLTTTRRDRRDNRDRRNNRRTFNRKLRELSSFHYGAIYKRSPHMSLKYPPHTNLYKQQENLMLSVQATKTGGYVRPQQQVGCFVK